MHLVTRFAFRGIYFPQMGKRAWARLVFANRRLIYSLAREGLRRSRRIEPAAAVPAAVSIAEG
jgi:hypothetical protein